MYLTSFSTMSNVCSKNRGVGVGWTWLALVHFITILGYRKSHGCQCQVSYFVFTSPDCKLDGAIKKFWSFKASQKIYDQINFSSIYLLVHLLTELYVYNQSCFETQKFLNCPISCKKVIPTSQKNIYKKKRFKKKGKKVQLTSQI